MATERRAEADIRADIATEREQLATALRDLRADVAATRRTAALAAVTVVGGLGLALALRAWRRT